MQCPLGRLSLHEKIRHAASVLSTSDGTASRGGARTFDGKCKATVQVERMGEHHKTRSLAMLTPSSIYTGALAGGLVGALLRGGVTFYNLRAGAELGFLAAMPSAGIGFLCGAVAGAFGRAGVGALLGAFLSAGVFALFMLPFAYVFTTLNALDRVADFTWQYFVQKAIAGAVAGGIGGWVGGVVAGNQGQRMRAGDGIERG